MKNRDWFLIVFLTLGWHAAPLMAQTASPIASSDHGPDAAACRTIFLSSTHPQLRLQEVSQRLDSRLASGLPRLVIVPGEQSADVVVSLAAGVDVYARGSSSKDTSILVHNLRTGALRERSTIWTDYAGMIASDIWEQLREVCPILLRPTPRVQITSSSPAADPTVAALRQVHRIFVL